MWARIWGKGRFSRWSFGAGFLLTLGSVGGVEDGGSLAHGIVLAGVGIALMVAAWLTYEDTEC